MCTILIERAMTQNFSKSCRLVVSACYNLQGITDLKEVPGHGHDEPNPLWHTALAGSVVSVSVHSLRGVKQVLLLRVEGLPQRLRLGHDRHLRLEIALH